MDRNAVQVMLEARRQDGKPAMTVKEVAAHFGVSERTIQRIRQEARVTEASDTKLRQERGVGRPSEVTRHHDAVAALVRDNPDAPALEILRQMRLAGHKISERTFYRVHNAVKELEAKEMVVRFEGVPGEFAQFDFGELDVRFVGSFVGSAIGAGKGVVGRVRRIHFAAYRLKYSRYMYVRIVPNQKSETVVRSLVAAFDASLGVPLSVVFDRPTTILLKEWTEVVTDSKTGASVEKKRREYNSALAQCSVDFGFVIDLAAPRSGNQKGCVEALVKFVKRNFFAGRTFVDMADLERQLAEWLIEVNTARPCDATGVIPSERLITEQSRMREPLCRPEEYGMKYPSFVHTTGMVHWWDNIRYVMPAEACGMPCTVVVYPEQVRIYTANKKYDETHPRYPETDGNGRYKVSYLPGQRSEQLARVHGDRKRLYYMRERIYELGEVGMGFLTELVHRRARTWQHDVERLFNLLERIGEQHFKELLKRALFQSLIGADYVERLAKQLPRDIQLGLHLQDKSVSHINNANANDSINTKRA